MHSFNSLFEEQIKNSAAIYKDIVNYVCEVLFEEKRQEYLYFDSRESVAEYIKQNAKYVDQRLLAPTIDLYVDLTNKGYYERKGGQVEILKKNCGPEHWRWTELHASRGQYKKKTKKTCKQYKKICRRCGTEYKAGCSSRFCPNCIKERSHEKKNI